MMNLYDMMDQAIAQELGITVKEYAARAEWILEEDLEKGEELIVAIMKEEEGACKNFMEATSNYC